MAIAAVKQSNYFWEGTDKKGARIKGKTTASNESAVKADLRRQGIVPVRIRKESFLSALGRGKKIEEILLGLHSSAMALGRSGRYLAIANAGSDTISILDTRKNQVVETISLRIEAGAPFGASPNALAFSPDGKHVLVSTHEEGQLHLIEIPSVSNKETQYLDNLPYQSIDLWGKVTSLDWSSFGDLIAVGTEDGEITF